MNNRFLLLFVVALLIIVVVVVIILALLFHAHTGSSLATATPVSAAGGVTVHNDTAKAVQVQDRTGALSSCPSSNMGTTQLAAGASGAEHGATGLRILNLQGGVVGCMSLAGVSNGSTVQVSQAKACP